METIVVYSTDDEHECDTCGTTWADSYHTFFKGCQLGVAAKAHCCGSVETSYSEVLEGILKELGYKVKIVECEE